MGDGISPVVRPVEGLPFASVSRVKGIDLLPEFVHTQTAEISGD